MDIRQKQISGLFRSTARRLQRTYRNGSRSLQRDFRLQSHPAANAEATLATLAETFTSLPFTSNNDIDLLVDGKQTFGEMLNAISQAKDYILLQTYIIHADEISTTFKNALIERAKQGVSVYMLYDGVGSHGLSRSYVEELEDHGVAVEVFRSSQGVSQRFQINFRNHRKILVVDGNTAFVGGFNIGDEYLGKDPKLGAWRDTHLKVRGTSVQCLQRVFLGDWYWATKDIPEVSWQTQAEPRLQPNRLRPSHWPCRSARSLYPVFPQPHQ